MHPGKVEVKYHTGGVRLGNSLESAQIIFEGMGRFCCGLIFYKWYFLSHS